MTYQALSSSRILSPPTRLEVAFPKGSRVLLKACPDAPAGIVTGHESTRVLVSWPEPNYLGHHRAEALTLVPAPVKAQDSTSKPSEALRGAGGQESVSREARDRSSAKFHF